MNIVYKEMVEVLILNNCLGYISHCAATFLNLQPSMLNVDDSLSPTFVAGQIPSTQSELHEQVHRYTHSDPSSQAA
jgi:hypothetical protein